MEERVLVSVDVGGRRHRAAVGDTEGKLLDEFDFEHTKAGFGKFFNRVSGQARGGGVWVAMEGYNGWARPLDEQVLGRGWRLFNVNNLKLARYKEIFPSTGKTDSIDCRKMLELFRLQETLPLGKHVLQEVKQVPLVHRELKHLTRRRRQLVNEKVSVVNRLQTNLQAACPGLLNITGGASNVWFLQFLTSRDRLQSLSRLKRQSLMKIPGVGKKYADKIQQWQSEAVFSEECEWSGAVIVEDAQRVFELVHAIKRLEKRIEEVSQRSPLARRLDSIPGFGKVGRAELAAEIGAMERFPQECSLAVYVGMAVLDHSSSSSQWSKPPKQVNRRAKAAMVRAAARHMQEVPESKDYYDKKRKEGKTHNQALRSLARHLVRVIWSIYKQERDYEIRPSTQKLKKAS
jgi:transposase